MIVVVIATTVFAPIVGFNRAKLPLVDELAPIVCPVNKTTSGGRFSYGEIGCRKIAPASVGNPVILPLVGE
jgi:hypothetical protein